MSDERLKNSVCVIEGEVEKILALVCESLRINIQSSNSDLQEMVEDASSELLNATDELNTLMNNFKHVVKKIRQGILKIATAEVFEENSLRGGSSRGGSLRGVSLTEESSSLRGVSSTEESSSLRGVFSRSESSRGGSSRGGSSRRESSSGGSSSGGSSRRESSSGESANLDRSQLLSDLKMKVGDEVYLILSKLSNDEIKLNLKN
jgi:hypothetical protein